MEGAHEDLGINDCARCEVLAKERYMFCTSNKDWV